MNRVNAVSCPRGTEGGSGCRFRSQPKTREVRAELRQNERSPGAGTPGPRLPITPLIKQKGRAAAMLADSSLSRQLTQVTGSRKIRARPTRRTPARVAGDRAKQVAPEATPQELSRLLEAAARGLLDYGGSAKTDFRTSITDYRRPGEVLTITLHRNTGGGI